MQRKSQNSIQTPFAYDKERCPFLFSRCPEAVACFKGDSHQKCPILDMIEFLPESFKVEINAYSCM